MSYIISSPVAISGSTPVTLNLTNTSSSQNWSLSTNVSDQLNIGSTLTPSIITLSSNGDTKLGNVINTVINSTTNTVTANNLRSATTTISIGGATAPTVGQTLVATSSTSANWQTPSSGGVTSISAASSSIILTPDPITTIGTVDIGNSIWTGNKATTPVAKEGIIDVGQSTTSSYTGIAATGNSLINLGTNNFTGTCKAVGAFCGGDGGGGVCNIGGSLNNSVISGISHILSGTSFDILVGGYLQTVSNCNNSIIYGDTNIASDCNTLNCLGFQNNVSNSDYCNINGYQNVVSDSFVTDVQGLQNSVTAGHTTLVNGYQNSFTGLATTANNSIWGFASLYPSNVYRFCDFRGSGISTVAATNHEGIFLYANGDPTGTPFNNGGAIKVPAGMESVGSGNLFSNWLNFGCNTAGDMRFLVKAPVTNFAPTVGDSLVNKTYSDSGIQTMTNKTLDSTTNVVTADNLHSATTTINVSSATAPTSGQVLTATSSTSADWQTPANANLVVIQATDNQVIAVPLTIETIYMDAAGGAGAGGATTASGAGGKGGGAAGCVSNLPMANTTGSFTVRVGTKGLGTSGGGTGYAAGGSGFGSAGGGGGSSSITNGNHTVIFCGGAGGGGWDDSGSGGGGGSTAGSNGTGINLPGAGGNGGGNGSAGGGGSGGVVYNSSIIVSGVGANTNGTTSGFLYSGSGGGNTGASGGSIIPMTLGGNNGSGNCGGGGSSAFANGGNGGNTTGGGNGSLGSGGGGSDGNVTANGGDGGDGFVKIWYFIP